MPPDERDAAYLWDMQEAILTIQRFCRDKSHQDYLTDDLFRSPPSNVSWKSSARPPTASARIFASNIRKSPGAA